MGDWDVWDSDNELKELGEPPCPPHNRDNQGLCHECGINMDALPDSTGTKRIALRFNVPADLDTPSEDLAAMKGLLLEALTQMYDRTSGSCFTKHECKLIEAIIEVR